MFDKELMLEYIEIEIEERERVIIYLGAKKLSEISISKVIALECAKDNKKVFERLKHKIENGEFDI